MAKPIITVAVAHPPKGTFFERHEDHPDGTAWVRGKHQVQVAETRKVLHAIAEGRIVMVQKSSPSKGTAKGTEKAQDDAESTTKGAESSEDQNAQPEPTEDAKGIVRTDQGSPTVLTDGPKGPEPSGKDTPRTARNARRT